MINRRGYVNQNAHETQEKPAACTRKKTTWPCEMHQRAICRFLAQTELPAQAGVPSLRCGERRGINERTEHRWRMKKGRKKDVAKRLRSGRLDLPFSAFKAGRATLNCRQFTVLSLAPDYRRKMRISLPLARAPETHRYLLSLLWPWLWLYRRAFFKWCR